MAHCLDCVLAQGRVCATHVSGAIDEKVTRIDGVRVARYGVVGISQIILSNQAANQLLIG